MKLSTLLENTKLSDKEVKKLVWALQSFLIESYPNFQTKVIPWNRGDEFNLAINWIIKDISIIISMEIFKDKFTIWFRYNDFLSSTVLSDTMLKSEEIQFDIIDGLNSLWKYTYNTEERKNILDKIHDGIIPSIADYLNR